MRRVTQAYVQGSLRTDGHTNEGIPGDCWRSALASLLDLLRDEVPHFALHPRNTWWWETRRWLQRRGLDLWFIPLDEPLRDFEKAILAERKLVLLAGPSPRGPFGHVVVGRPDGTVVWDPHPSRAGLRAVEEVFAIVEPYGHMEDRRALCVASSP